MIKQAEGDYVPAELEKRVSEFWSKARVYVKTRKMRAAGKDFYFCDGPPYTSGAIHLGTAMNKVIKDTVVRWRRMHDFNVRDQPGYDMHGLPIEVQVEKALGITNKKEIEALGVEKFIATCRQFAEQHRDTMTEQFQALGVWLDWANPYTTVTNQYLEAAWWTLGKAHDKGLLVEALRSVSWCPRCETALAEAEIEYEMVKDPSVFVRLALVGRPHESLVVWTTTPWTLPANLAAAVHPQFQYSKVRVALAGTTEFLWMLTDRVAALMKEWGVTEYESVDTAVGASLAGWEYEPLLADKVPYHTEVKGQWVHKVLNSDTVAAEDTGIVHIAPGHGPEDFEIGLRHGLPVFCPVDERGRFTAEAGAYASKPTRETNEEIVGDLEERGRLVRHATVSHRYGQCWRCRTPILYRATRQWFLKVTDLKPTMLEEIARVKWTPDWAGSSRQKEWTGNIRDWCISRQRYWGIPLPVWRCESCQEIRVLRSEKDLAQGAGYTAGMDLHRPGIDGITLPCLTCGATMRRVPDVIDVWFDSGIASWAQLLAVKGDLERWFPADWITEASDQTRGWFSSQLAAGIIAFDGAPYESVLLHGWMNGPDGQPMSKSKGNNIEPAEVVEKHGVDALRLYLLKVNAPWEDVNFQWDEVKNAQRTLNTLWNVYKFATTYMVMDGFRPEAFSIDSLVRFMRPEDKWMLSRAERLKGAVDAEMEAFNLHRAARLIEDFIVEDLSRLYVRLIRDRSWKEGEGDKGKLAAYKVLHEALLTAVRVLAPFCPYLTEELYQNLDGRLLSVHMNDWPEASADWMHADLEASMATTQELVSHLLRVRQKANLKLRWPLSQVAIKAAPEGLAKALGLFREVFLAQANVKTLTLLGPEQEFAGLDYTVKPNPEAISRVYKMWWTKISTMLENKNPMEVKKALDRGEFRLGIEGQVIRIQPHMVSLLKKVPQGVLFETGPFGELYVDMRVTPEIQAEGFGREIIRRVQQMRKELDLEVEDYVRTSVKTTPALAALLEPWKEAISRDTRSRNLTIGEQEVSEEYVVEWNVEGANFLIGITPYHMAESLRTFTRLPGMTESKAMLLFDSGYSSADSLQLATREELTRIAGLSRDEADAIHHHFEAPAGSAVHCPVCQGELIGGAQRCLRCGEYPSEKPCPHCGAGLFQAQEQCDICGLSTSAAPPPEPPPAAVVQTAPAPIAASPPPASALSPPPIAHVPAAPAPPSAPVPAPSLPPPAAPAAIVPVPVEPAPPATREPPPPAATRAEPPAGTTVRESSIYLVLENRTDRAWKVFSGEIKRGRRGFCVTRNYPDKIRASYPDLAGTPIVWLSNVGKDDAVRPKDLEKLSLSLEQFIGTEGGIVLLDGIEYLITNNNFITVLRLVQSLRDQIAINRAILICPVNPLTLDQNQLSLLEREADAVWSGDVEMDGGGAA